MEWISEILGAAGSVAGGGVFGLLSSGIGAVVKYKQVKAEREYKKDEWKHELALHELQNQRDENEREHELEVVASQGSWTNLEASINADASIKGGQITNNIKSLFRPFLTVMLWVIAGWIFYMMANATSDSMLGKAFTQEEMLEIIRYMVYTVFFCASTATVWWYGDRAFAPPGMKNK